MEENLVPTPSKRPNRRKLKFFHKHKRKPTQDAQVQIPRVPQQKRRTVEHLQRLSIIKRLQIYLYAEPLLRARVKRSCKAMALSIECKGLHWKLSKRQLKRV